MATIKVNISGCSFSLEKEREREGRFDGKREREGGGMERENGDRERKREWIERERERAVKKGRIAYKLFFQIHTALQSHTQVNRGISPTDLVRCGPTKVNPQTFHPTSIFLITCKTPV